ncbi:uncharacterized protein LOC115622217 [Scaptodrosophila lebanonensis]|uniref:Uncharacterized protein LOC115622217 n=1 Tax=Drosophila lebanonensis TaxID=7225 RepID=A0A6J2T7I4_DROLE|nr:uncharacterized protein LOC115622217 [Scaptodrosophila lebanonensis]
MYIYKYLSLATKVKEPRFYDRAVNKPFDKVFVDGTEVRVILTFCELHNCSVQVDTSNDDWGEVNGNGTGTGLLGMVVSRRNDYCMGGMPLYHEAYQSIDFTTFFSRSGITCLVPAPRLLINWDQPLRPFQATLWICVLFCLLLECVALCVMRRLENMEASLGIRGGSNSWRQSMRFGYVSALKLFVNQSTSYVTSSYSLRTVLLASYMIDIILTTGYSGGLAVILTLPAMEEAADSRRRLFEHKLTWVGTTPLWISAIDSNDADPELLGIIQHFRVMDAAHIDAYSRTEQMAFVVERLQFGHLANAEIIPDEALSRLKLMVDDIYFSYTATIVPRLWAHLEAYNGFILAWHSSGLDKFWEWKIAANYMNNNRQNRILASQKLNLNIGGPIKLGIDNIIGLIMLWCFGMACSLLVFLFELCSDFFGHKLSTMVPTQSYWTSVLNFLMQRYFADSLTTCILWNSKFELQLDSATSTLLPVLVIEPQALTFHADIYDYETKRAEFDSRYISYNDWILKLTVAIEQAHCEAFIAFQDHIPEFAKYFYNASIFSAWRSTRNRFIFAYTDELLGGVDPNSYFGGYIFHDQANILIVHAQFLNASVFGIKTNRFVGARNFDDMPEPPTFYELQRFDAVRHQILSGDNEDALFLVNQNKLANLQGREVVIGVFDYKPFMLLNYDNKPRLFDRAIKKPFDEVFVDGTDFRLMLNFCELHNCSMQVDTTDGDWGDVYGNATGYGLVGMVLSRRNDYAIGGMPLWYEAYQSMDITHFLGRSGVTCLVPAPRRLINWDLPMRPFQASLWVCVLFCLLLECVALCLTRRLEYLEAPATAYSWRQSVQFSYVSALKLFVNQSTSYVTSSYSLRTVLLASYMIDIILTTVYSGGLASILTLPAMEEAADSRRRLFEHKLTWAGTSQVWISTIDINGADPELLGLMQHYRVLDAAHIDAYSRTEQMAFVVERLQFGHLGNAELIPDQALSRLKLMVDDIYFSYTVAIVPRLWAHLEAYNDFILAWHSSGLDKFWEWKIAADYMNNNRQNRIVASQKLNVDVKGPIKLGIDNFIGLIMLWCFGMTWSLLVFVWNIRCLWLVAQRSLRSWCLMFPK